MLLTYNFPKPHEENILNMEVYVQYCSLGTYFDFWKSDLEFVWDAAYREMKLEAVPRGILKISKT